MLTLVAVAAVLLVGLSPVWIGLIQDYWDDRRLDREYRRFRRRSHIAELEYELGLRTERPRSLLDHWVR